MDRNSNLKESYLKWHLSQLGGQVRLDHFPTEHVLGGDLVDEVGGQTQLWPLGHVSKFRFVSLASCNLVTL